MAHEEEEGEVVEVAVARRLLDLARRVLTQHEWDVIDMQKKGKKANPVGLGGWATHRRKEGQEKGRGRKA